MPTLRLVLKSPKPHDHDSRESVALPSRPRRRSNGAFQVLINQLRRKESRRVETKRLKNL